MDLILRFRKSAILNYFFAFVKISYGYKTINIYNF